MLMSLDQPFIVCQWCSRLSPRDIVISFEPADFPKLNHVAADEKSPPDFLPVVSVCTQLSSFMLSPPSCEA